MQPREMLTQIDEWISGSEWNDWKTRRISDDKLLAQREIVRWLFEAGNDCILVTLLPEHDDAPIRLVAGDKQWWVTWNNTNNTELNGEVLRKAMREIEDATV